MNNLVVINNDILLNLNELACITYLAGVMTIELKNGTKIKEFIESSDYKSLIKLIVRVGNTNESK